MELFFSFEREETQKPSVMEFLIDAAIENEYGTIFLDEVHLVDEWEYILKQYCTPEYDKVSFIVSASNLHWRERGIN